MHTHALARQHHTHALARQHTLHAKSPLTVQSRMPPHATPRPRDNCTLNYACAVRAYVRVFCVRVHVFVHVLVRAGASAANGSVVDAARMTYDIR